MDREHAFLVLILIVIVLFGGGVYLIFWEKNARSGEEGELCFMEKQSPQYPKICMGVTEIEGPTKITQELQILRGIPQNHSYLLRFRDEGIYAVTMRGIEYTHDAVWIDRNHEVIAVEEDLAPCRVKPCEIYRPPKPVHYLIELPENTLKQLDIKVGYKVILPPS